MTEEEYQADMLKKYQADMVKVKQAIIDGKIYANINSVSRSGMSRRISFYMVDETTEYAPETDEGYIRNTFIRNVTREVAWLTKWVKVGEHKSRGEYMIDFGLHVDGCGMDMIFHTLYSTLSNDEAREWGQKYSRL